MDDFHDDSDVRLRNHCNRWLKDIKLCEIRNNWKYILNLPCSKRYQIEKHFLRSTKQCLRRRVCRHRSRSRRPYNWQSYSSILSSLVTCHTALFHHSNVTTDNGVSPTDNGVSPIWNNSWKFKVLLSCHKLHYSTLSCKSTRFFRFRPLNHLKCKQD